MDEGMIKLIVIVLLILTFGIGFLFGQLFFLTKELFENRKEIRRIKEKIKALKSSVCPDCEGEGIVDTGDAGASDTCHKCGGTGLSLHDQG
jgi:hypothetical protein